MAQPPPGQGKGQGQGGPGAGQRTSTSGSTPAAAPRSTTGAAVPRAPTSGSVPAARSPTGEQPVRRSPTLSGLPNARAGVAAFELGGTTDSKSYKKGINQSAFTGEEERTQVDALLGGRRPARPPEDESTSVGKTFDGVTPAPEVTSRDVWKAFNAPLQSREGRRSPDLYKQVINQFAAGHNPRYEAEDPNKPRAHIFVWDVTRAMNAEIPHFVGPRELSLAQTCDWLRHEGPMRGWRRADMQGAVTAANEGKPVVALPKNTTLRGLGVVRPGEVGPDGRPRFAAAGHHRGNDLGAQEALGVSALEFFVHD